MVSAVILDFDGVIVESEAAKDGLFRELFARYPAHFEAMVAFHEHHRSMPRQAKIEHLVFALLGRPGDHQLVATLVAEFGSLAVERVAACPLVPGARELLDHYVGRVPLYLASVTPRDDLLEILRRRGLEAYFHGVFGDPPISKTAAVQLVLVATGARPSEVALIGDSQTDADVAAAAGLRFIGRQLPGAAAHGPFVFPNLHGVLEALRLGSLD